MPRTPRVPRAASDPAPVGRPVERRAPPGSIAEVLQNARESRGLTRAQLAEKIGTQAPSITRVESGEGDVSEGMIRKYARALQMRVVLQLVPEEDP